MKTSHELPGSFRDPSGFVFSEEGRIYRGINSIYKDHYDRLMGSGLYEKLTSAGLLIPHVEVDIPAEKTGSVYKVIRPEIIPFISYPYEWCFSQLKDAALTTLRIQKIALDFGMSLKDSSAYNIQFRNGKPVLIDTLSFEVYPEGRPWIAYRQFCQHFLAPLALMSYKDIRLSQLFRIHIDGIPLDLASSLLPSRTRFSLGLLSHVHLHARSQKRYADKPINVTAMKKISRLGLLAIIDNLESAVGKLEWEPRDTEWSSYYEDTNYSPEAFRQKERFLSEFLDTARPKNLWDIGANTGVFSRIASNKGIPTISFDVDCCAVEKNYLESVKNKETNILPLLLDLTNPSPGIGWENEERASWLKRGPADAVFALALIHHLAITNNVPLGRIALFFSRIGNWLVIEFVPKTDSQVRRLLLSREDIFPTYTEHDFTMEFEKLFEIVDTRPIPESARTLYLMRRR